MVMSIYNSVKIITSGTDVLEQIVQFNQLVQILEGLQHMSKVSQFLGSL